MRKFWSLVFSVVFWGVLFGMQFADAQTWGNLGIRIPSASTSSTSGLSLNNPWGLPSSSISGIITNLAYWLLGIFAIVGVIGFLVSGFYYLLDFGSTDLNKKGKQGMIYSIIGILIGLSGLIIINAAFRILSAQKNF